MGVLLFHKRGAVNVRHKDDQDDYCSGLLDGCTTRVMIEGRCGWGLDGSSDDLSDLEKSI